MNIVSVNNVHSGGRTSEANPGRPRAAKALRTTMSSLLSSYRADPATPNCGAARPTPCSPGGAGWSTAVGGRLVLVATLLLVVLGGVWGTSVFAALSGGGFEDPGSESIAAATVDRRPVRAPRRRRHRRLPARQRAARSRSTTRPSATAVESALATVPASDLSSVGHLLVDGTLAHVRLRRRPDHVRRPAADRRRRGGARGPPTGRSPTAWSPTD